MSTLRPISAKRSALLRQTNKARSDYVKESQVCQVCMIRFAAECHEICRGASRSEAIKHRELWIAACRHCHALLGDYSIYPITRQLAVKLLRDTKFFDLALVNKVRGRAENAIDMADVCRHLELKP